MANGLYFMHSLNPPIIHRDFKSPNVMVSSFDPNVPCAKIIDFGTSKYFTEPLVDKIVDNPLWLAPEVLDSKPYDLRIDIYAFGIVLWELFSRSKIFEEEKFISRIHSLIVEGERLPIPSHCPETYKRVITSCWNHNPDQRPSWPVVINWLGELNNNVREIEIRYIHEYENNLLHLKLGKQKEELEELKEKMRRIEEQKIQSLREIEEQKIAPIDRNENNITEKIEIIKEKKR